MFCPKCGNNNPEDVRFCKSCGNPLNLNNPFPAYQQTQPAQPAQQYAPQQPTQQFAPQQPMQQVAPQAASKMVGKPKSKTGYLFGIAPKSLKTTALISLILGVVCILAVVLGANTALNGDVFELPLITMLVSEDDIDQARDSVKKAIDAVEEAIDLDKEDEIEELEEKTGMKVKKVIDALDPPSLNSMDKLGKAVLEDDSTAEVFSMFISIIEIYAIVAGAFIALSMLIGRGGFAIFSLIIALPFHIFLSGSLWLIIGAIAHLAMIVCMFKTTSSYKKYKKSFAK